MKPAPADQPTGAEIIHYLRELCVTPAPIAPPKANEQIVHVHPVLKVDFWFIVLALTSNLLMASSFTPRDSFEPLVFGAIFCGIMAMIANLTRDREQVHVYKFRLEDARPRASGKLLTLRERQVAAGVKPVEYPNERPN